MQPHDLAYSVYTSGTTGNPKGVMHDIGKVAVGNEILEKPGKLDEWEYSVMKDHARATLDILGGIEGFEDLTEWAASSPRP